MVLVESFTQYLRLKMEGREAGTGWCAFFLCQEVTFQKEVKKLPRVFKEGSCVAKCVPERIMILILS